MSSRGLRGKGAGLGLAPIDVIPDEETEINVAEGTVSQNSRFQFDAHEVVPNVLWVGSVRAAQNVEELKRQGFSHVLNMSRRPLSEKTKEELKVTSFDVKDIASQKMWTTWAEAVVAIQESKKLGEMVLLCCHRGISRSVATACAYLMITEGKLWEDALRVVQTARSIAAPNFEFCRQLYVFQQVNFDPAEAAMKYDALVNEFAGSIEYQRMSPVRASAPGSFGIPAGAASPLLMGDEAADGYDSEASSAPTTSTHGSPDRHGHGRYTTVIGGDALDESHTPVAGDSFVLAEGRGSSRNSGRIKRKLPTPTESVSSDGGTPKPAGQRGFPPPIIPSPVHQQQPGKPSLGIGGRAGAIANAIAAAGSEKNKRSDSFKGEFPEGKTLLSELRPGSQGDVLLLKPGVRQEDITRSTPLQEAVVPQDAVVNESPTNLLQCGNSSGSNLSALGGDTGEEEMEEPKVPSVQRRGAGARNNKRKLPGAD